MRYSTDLLFLGLLAAFAGWYTRAPGDPAARALYLCAPVIASADAASRLAAAMNDDGRIAPPLQSWRFDPGRECTRVLERFYTDARR
jgi:hypothetical protein